MGEKKLLHQAEQIDWSSYEKIINPMHYLKNVLYEDSHEASSIFIGQKQINGDIWTVERSKLAHIDNLRIGQEKYKLGMNDLYVNINPLFDLRERGTKENVSWINWAWCDIDNREGVPNFAHITLQRLQEDGIIADGQSGKLPQPTFILESGSGVWLFWRVATNGRYDWDKLEHVNKGICKVLEPYGADSASTNVNRISRVVGSVHSGTQRTVTALVNENIRYSLDRDFGYFYPIKTRKAKEGRTEAQREASAKHSVNLKNNYELAMMKHDDAIELIKLRGGKLEGYRNKLMFILASSFCLLSKIATNDPNWIFEQLDEVNQMLDDPLSDNELLRIIDKANIESTDSNGETFYGIKWRNDTICDWLDLTLDEQRKMKHLRSSDMRRKIKNEKNKIRKREERGSLSAEERKAKRKAEQMEKAKAIKKAIQDDPNISNRKLAEKLGVSAVAIGKIRKKYNI